MEMHGSITENLKLAVQSSRRLRGHPIYRDTIRFWSDLLHEARAQRALESVVLEPEVQQLIAELEIVVAENGS